MQDSTQKIPVRHKNARFDTKMPYPACISWHSHYQTSPPPPFSLKLFSNFNQTFCFKEPMHKLKKKCQNGSRGPLVARVSQCNKNLVIWVNNHCQCHPTLIQGQCHVESIENVGDWFSSALQPLINNLTLFWNSSYQIPKSLFSKCIMCEDSYPQSIKWQSCYLQKVCIKKSNFRPTLLPLWSVHMCAVLLGSHWPLWRLARNNGKLLAQA